MGTPGEQGLTVAFFSSARAYGGGEEQLRLLAAGLRRRGAACAVFAREGGPLAARLQAEGFDVIPLAGRGLGPRSLWKTRQRLRRLRPDVLHYNDSHAMSAGGLAAVGLSGPARIAARRTVFPLRSALQYRLLADRVICVSQAAAEVCRAGGLPAGMVRVVYDGVDAARVASGDRRRGRDALGIRDTQVLLLTVAQLTDCKGHTYLLDALPEVLRNHPEAIAVLAGDGELRGRLEAQARSLGIDRQVRFVGYRQDVPDLVQAADLFVLPSHTEALGSSLIDAMLAARPIVTTTAGGIPEVTGSGDRPGEPLAWTVPPRDCRALARAILAALDCPRERQERSDRARRRAEELFTAERMVEGTLEVYREVLPGTGGE